ncbi:hypothetical protein BV25DRAFT_1917281 [Artomyces pyxidatus]|uniref:Uncharacterized protein n=1 Tax=Artomyces pyxidatus TaxID=48021 RepID=A0ACB8SYS1_9AGAM|nr:hypothetical protein BV25DRAFT_1917281 [Artomyces pyxidatus]
MSRDGTETDLNEESEELRRFRQQWKEEVQRKRHQTSASAGDSTSSEPVAKPVPHTPAQNEVIPLIPSGDEPATSFPSNGNLRSRRNALETYRQAVKCEQASNLDEALRLYRAAFRMDSDIDRVYHREEVRAAVLASSSGHKKTPSQIVDLPTVEVVPEPAKAPAARVQHVDRTLSGEWARVLAAFPVHLMFEPEDERAPSYLESLPEELLVHIVRFLGTSAIERFAAVNRKARVITLESNIWREFVETIYKPPQIPEDEPLEEIVGRYSGDFRRVYIEQPRVRLDGVYIAVCHYVRQGQSENAWVNISHLITYHRYLRFYPNGQVISLLANEEHEPQHVITVLRPTLRMKGFFIGTWRLVGTTVFITNLLDPANPSARYSFQMTLTLRSRPVGRWNRLDFDGYDSVNIESGEAMPLALKNERPFWFSKVRSYSAKAE